MDRHDGLIVVWMNVASQHDDELSAWYECEHVAEIAALPGVRSVQRFLDPAHPLRYMACFECTDETVEIAPAFVAMLENPSPWTRRIRTLFGEQRQRGNYRKSRDTGSNGLASALVVVQSRQVDVGGAADVKLPADCNRYRAFELAPPAAAIRPSLPGLEIYDFPSLQKANAARASMALPAGTDVSVRHAIGTPVRVSQAVYRERLLALEVQAAAAAISQGVRAPASAAVQPAVQYTLGSGRSA